MQVKWILLLVAMFIMHGFWYQVSLLLVPTAKDLILLHHEISPVHSIASWDPTFLEIVGAPPPGLP